MILVFNISSITSAFVSPIFKKGNRSKRTNDRAVCLTCICSKLVEYLITSSVMTHLNYHHILTDAQTEFRKQRSCESQLILTVRDLAQGTEEKSQLDVILLDFLKEFEKVPYARLYRTLWYDRSHTQLDRAVPGRKTSEWCLEQ